MIDSVAFTITLGSVSKEIYWYGIIVATAMLVGIIVAMYHARLRGYNSEDILDLSIIAVVLAVLGARAHYVIWSWDLYKAGPFWKVFAIWEGGLAIYGGLIGGLIGAYIFSKWKKMRFFAITDIVIPSLLLGQAIGRWGNFANQEAYGYAIANAKLMYFPIAVFIQDTGQYHMATFFYESMWNLLGFAFMARYLKRPRQEGNILFLYLLIYGIGRVVIEGMRMDSQMFLDTSIRVNQVISAIAIIVGAGGLLFRKSGKIAEVHDARFVNIERKEKVEVPTGPVSNELKLMSDEMRNQRKRRIEQDAEHKATSTLDTSKIKVETQQVKPLEEEKVEVEPIVEENLEVESIVEENPEIEPIVEEKPVIESSVAENPEIVPEDEKAQTSDKE